MSLEPESSRNSPVGKGYTSQATPYSVSEDYSHSAEQLFGPLIRAASLFTPRCLDLQCEELSIIELIRALSIDGYDVVVAHKCTEKPNKEYKTAPNQ